MPKTLNKDGTFRKIGSGKTKGAGCYSPITWTELKNLVSDDIQIPVSRVWLRSLGGLSEDGSTSRGSLHPSASPPSTVSTKEDDQPKKESSIPSIPKEEPPSSESVEDYEPPPLFAGRPSKFRQY
jgi:hypothetical protein